MSTQHSEHAKRTNEPETECYVWYTWYMVLHSLCTCGMDEAHPATDYMLIYVMYVDLYSRSSTSSKVYPHIYAHSRT